MTPFSDEELATLAEKLRKAAAIPLHVRLDASVLVEKFEKDSNASVRILFKEVSAELLRGALARAEPLKRIVYYIKGLREKLVSGDSLAAFVFLEEIAHVVLRHEAKVMDHAIGRNIRISARPEIQRMESEAQKFAWYTLAPISEVYSTTDPQKLMADFGMTPKEAIEYCSHLAVTRRRIDGTCRELPDKVVELRPKPQAALAQPMIASNENSPEERQLRSRYSGYSHVPCSNCKMMTVMRGGGCELCTNCGEESGCA